MSEVHCSWWASFGWIISPGRSSTSSACQPQRGAQHGTGRGNLGGPPLKVHAVCHVWLACGLLPQQAACPVRVLRLVVGSAEPECDAALYPQHCRESCRSRQTKGSLPWLVWTAERRSAPGKQDEALWAAKTPGHHLWEAPPAAARLKNLHIWACLSGPLHVLQRPDPSSTCLRVSNELSSLLRSRVGLALSPQRARTSAPKWDAELGSLRPAEGGGGV